jgi:hypothetical protein
MYIDIYIYIYIYTSGPRCDPPKDDFLLYNKDASCIAANLSFPEYIVLSSLPIYVYVYEYTCMYTYIYTYIHVYIYIYINTQRYTYIYLD